MKATKSSKRDYPATGLLLGLALGIVMAFLPVFQKLSIRWGSGKLMGDGNGGRDVVTL